MKKELYEFIQENGVKTNMLFKDYVTHVSVIKINSKDIDDGFGETRLVTSKPQTIKETLEYVLSNLYKYTYKVVECTLIGSK